MLYFADDRAASRVGCRGPSRPIAVTDTPSNFAPPPTPTVSAIHAHHTALTLGFLTILHDANGALGGYLVTNAWGRPLEFRLSTAVQPNRVQQILYGPTLTEYLHADLIGKTLVEKTGAQPTLIVTDSIPALALRNKLNVPVVAIRPDDLELSASDVLPLPHPRSSVLLVYEARHAADRQRLEEILERVDPAVDLAEPFSRIREAVGEARKMGVTNRAA
jgi:hypothetical protein